ncbi:hypothetical protein [Pseudomonas putida]|uniref:hypothetical protein n=1 Tax=Pseudomonas putida TaxID=303 RepID=UPI003905D332
MIPIQATQKPLPGSLDIVLMKYTSAIFVQECFWHRHQNCKYATTQKIRQDYWIPKLNANVEWDVESQPSLTRWANKLSSSGGAKR